MVIPCVVVIRFFPTIAEDYRQIRNAMALRGIEMCIRDRFKGPHERVCSTQAELRQRIRKTVLHEIGHFFGFDDEYLHSHGY